MRLTGYAWADEFTMDEPRHNAIRFTIANCPRWRILQAVFTGILKGGIRPSRKLASAEEK